MSVLRCQRQGFQGRDLQYTVSGLYDNPTGNVLILRGMSKGAVGAEACECQGCRFALTAVFNLMAQTGCNVSHDTGKVILDASDPCQTYVCLNNFQTGSDEICSCTEVKIEITKDVFRRFDTQLPRGETGVLLFVWMFSGPVPSSLAPVRIHKILDSIALSR